MAVTLQQVRQMLLPEEPNYGAAARLGPEALAHLRTLVQGPDKGLASKAAYLAGLIQHDGASDVLRVAAASPSAAVRIAAAGAARHLRRPSAAGVVLALLDDRDAGVRKMAVKSASARGDRTLLAKVVGLSRTDPAPMIRALASRVASAAPAVVAEVDFESTPEECARRCGEELRRCVRASSNSAQCLANYSACLRRCGGFGPAPPGPGPIPVPPGPTPPVPASLPPAIRRGSRGPAVRLAQAKLNAWIRKTGAGIAPLVVDGVFGPVTDAAVRRYQQSVGLPPDGVVGPQTWRRLLAE